jgi:tetratricopeptide (TPR) repeat protein
VPQATAPRSRNQKQATAQTAEATNAISIWRKTPLFLLGCILILAPCFRGLFFTQDFLWFAFAIGMLGVLTVWLYPAKSADLMECALLSLALWYSVSLPWAISKGEAVTGAVRMLSYASLYFVARRILAAEFLKIGTAILSGLMTAIVWLGISSASGFPPIKDAWQSGLGSFFQYHNALGGYLLIGIPISIWLYEEGQTYWTKTLALCAVYFLFLGLAGTQSRGAWICFGIVLALIFPALRYRLVTGGALAVVLWAALVSWGLISCAKTAHPELVWIYPLAGLALVVPIAWIGGKIQSQASLRKAIPLLGFIVLLLMAGTVPLFSPTANSDFDLVRRAQKVNLNETTWKLRMAYYRDAISMGLKRPATGFGGGAWGKTFRAYQTTYYRSKNIHSEPLEIFVEAGFPGLVLYLLFWAAFLREWMKTWGLCRTRPDCLLGVAPIGIFLHSLIDFDLSESAIVFTTLVVLAAWQNINASRGKSERAISDQMARGHSANLIQVSKFAALASAFVLILATPILSLGLDHANAGAAFLRSGQVDKALAHYHAAMKFFPVQSDARSDLALLQTSEGRKLGDTYLVQEGIRNIEQAIQCDPMNPLVRKMAVRIYAASGHWREAYLQTLAMVRLGPLYTLSYESVATYGLAYAEDLLKSQQTHEAAQVLDKIIGLPAEIEARVRPMPPRPGGIENEEPPLHASKQLRDSVAHAQTLRNELK